MATVNAVIGEISERVGDFTLEQITKEQVLVLINAAARDLIGSGLVIGLQDDESLTIGAATYEYAVPASFTYISNIFEETGAATGIYTNWVPWQRWQLKVGLTGVPVIWFDDQLFTVNAGRRLRLLGHRRPNDAYTIGTGEIDTGLDAFIRERATAMAARQLSISVEGAEQGALENIAGICWASSEALLRTIAAQEHFQPKRYARAVPLR